MSEMSLDWAGLSPMIIVLGAAFVGPVVDAPVPKSRRLPVQVSLTVLALAAAFIAVVLNAGKSATAVSLGGTDLGSVALDGPGLFLQGTSALLAIVAVL